MHNSFQCLMKFFTSIILHRWYFHCVPRIQWLYISSVVKFHHMGNSWRRRYVCWFQRKVATVMVTSPGPMGGLRMVRSLNQMLQDMGATVVPGSNSIGSAYKVIENDEITDERTKSKIDATCENLVHFCRYEANREHDCAVAKQVFSLTNMGEYGEVDLPN